MEFLSLTQLANRYGVLALHFYLIGSVPALLFLAVITLPAYIRNGIHSVPDYLRAQFGPAFGRLSAACSLVFLCCVSAALLSGMAEILSGWLTISSRMAAFLVAFIAACLFSAGGIRFTVVAEIFQYTVLMSSLLVGVVLFFLANHGVPTILTQSSIPLHLWRHTPLISNRTPIDLVAIIAGQGIVIGGAYWNTDVVVIQRALTVRTARSARTVPLLVALGKMATGILVLVPVVYYGSDWVLRPGSVGNSISQISDSRQLILSIQLIAVLAGLFSAILASVNSFAALATQDVLGKSIIGDQRASAWWIPRTLATLCLGIAWLTIPIIEKVGGYAFYMLLLFSTFTIPAFAMLLLSFGSKGLSTRAAMRTYLLGAGFALLLHFLLTHGKTALHSDLAANIYMALGTFIFTLGVGFAGATTAKDAISTQAEPHGTEYPASRINIPPLTPLEWCLIILVILIFVCLNIFLQ